MDIKIMTERLQACKKAIDEAGGTTAVARYFGIKPPAVSQWRQVPHNRVLQLEALTMGRVTRYEMRPDIFGYLGK